MKTPESWLVRLVTFMRKSSQVKKMFAFIANYWSEQSHCQFLAMTLTENLAKLPRLVVVAMGLDRS
jgi:hypothetical protein